MRREIRKDLLVTEWTKEKQEKHKEQAKEHRKERKKESDSVRILKNRGWNRFYRKYRPVNMSIREFAKECTIHEYTISRWDKGTGSPTFRLLFDFLGYVSDTKSLPIEKVFLELWDMVEEYGNEEFEK
jgi:transcriptional regulator with XRE-family HTH domain